MKILKISCKKRHKKGIKYTWMPKDKTHSGHMDTQMYPECEFSRFNRDIVKKTREKKRKEKKSFNLSRYIESRKACDIKGCQCQK